MARHLTVPEKHLLRIARDTLKLSDAMVQVVGGPSKAEAREIIRQLTGRAPKGNPYSARAKYRHRRVRAPSRFAPGSFRTVRAGTARVVVGRLKGSRTRTRTGRRRLTVQAVLTPKRGRNPVRFSESFAWLGIVKRADHIQELAGPGTIANEAGQIIRTAAKMLKQLKRGVHANPSLALVGANPLYAEVAAGRKGGGVSIGYRRHPRENPRGQLLGYVVGKLRYRRTVGQHPGWYYHDFKTRARLLAMPDGSLRIAS